MRRPGRWHEARRRWRHSLKWRLVTVFLLLALATTAVFMFGTQRALQSGWQGWVRPIVADYADRLVAEIGSPPDPARAAALAARLPITLRIDGPQVQYDSQPPRDATERARRFDPSHWGLTRTSADGHRISFGLAGPSPESRPRLFGWFTLAGLLLLTALAFAWVRRLLRPLEAIGEGVARFGAGLSAPPIAVQRRDELGELTDRINRMAGSLHGMLDAKRALLLAISHELRSPLTRARVNAELVPEGEHRDALLRDLAQMRDLITDLLESERLAAGHAALHTEPVDLAALVREVADGGFAGRVLRLDVDPSIGPVPADATRLRLLLRNLIDNALRHSAGAAEVPTVFLARDVQGELALGVRDHGPGVDDEQLQRLAEPFYRADSARTRSAGGVGLGLYLCRLVARAHGGELTLERAGPGLRVAMRWRPAGR